MQPEACKNAELSAEVSDQTAIRYNYWDLQPNLQTLGSRLRSAIGAKAFAAKDRSAGRRLEGNSVGFSALIAGNVEALTFAAATLRTAKV
jgi:hypothetical protein